ncbi:MAG: zinc-ribbon domain-containing protein [Schwartzia sp.]|nr:zinc-ribbon domain-containing protein [Schwartzia sp. (in: firmicutes)]
MMKICPKCNAKLTDDTFFCTNCGQNLTEIETNAHTNGNPREI